MPKLVVRERVARRAVVRLLVAMVLVLASVGGSVAGAEAVEAIEVTASAAGDVEISRIAGPNRIATSIEVARAGWDAAPTVLLARSDIPADAFSGTPLAAALGAPILVTPSTHLDGDVRVELRRLGTTRAILLGGPGALSASVANELAASGLSVERLAGRNRADTAAVIARRLGPHMGDTAFVVGTWRGALAATGAAAVLAAGGIAAPMLLAPDDLGTTTREAIADLGIRRVVIADPSGEVDLDVDAELRALGVAVERIDATSVASLSALLAERFPAPDGTGLLLATADDFPDALSAGALVGRVGRVLLLTPSARVEPDVADAVARIAPEAIEAIGGLRAIDERVVVTLAQHALRLHGEPDGPRGVVIRLVTPEDDLADVVDASPAGAQFVLAAGVHRLSRPVDLKDNMHLAGRAGAVVSGARLVEPSSWQRRPDGRWETRATVEVPTSGRYGSGDWRNLEWADPTFERAVFRGEELFVDGQRQRHVNELSLVDAPGEWFYDTAADRAIVAFDPRRHVAEISEVDFAFLGDGTRRVVIEDLEVRHFATVGNRAAVNGRGGTDWVLRHLWVHDNHAMGIGVGRGMQLDGIRATDNGQVGIGGDGELDPAHPIHLRRSEVARNGVVGYDTGWSSGGLKLTGTRGLVLEHVWSHDNRGKGIWLDIDNADAVIRHNLVERNTTHGIFYEISYAARIHDNIVRHNGTSRGIHAGIFIVDSRDVEVDHNHVHGQQAPILASHQNRTTLSLGLTEVRNLDVHDNVVSATDRMNGMASQESARTDVWASAMGNRFRANTYLLTESAARSWDGDRMLDWSEWQAAGQDRDGSLTLTSSPGDFPGTSAFTWWVYGPRS